MKNVEAQQPMAMEQEGDKGKSQMPVPQIVAGALAVLVIGGLVWFFTGRQTESEVGPSPTPGAGTLCQPMPYLTWDTPICGEGAPERADGTLVVPLDPRNADGPKLSLRVRMRPAATQPAPLGTMIFHCGGPGSARNCVDFLVPNRADLEEDLANQYNTFSIDQRGISDPVLHCGETQAVLPPVSNTTRPTSMSAFFPDCPCDGAPSGNFRFHTGEGSDKWTAAADYFNTLGDVWQACHSGAHLQKDGYNVMDYMGTAYLAHDLDLLRAAIGEEKLSHYGISYGTWVGSVYASLYPENTGKVIIIGNLPPAPTVHNFARDYAISQQGVRAEFVDRCRKLANCTGERGRDPEDAFRSLTEMLEAGEVRAETNFGHVSLSPLFITGQMHGRLRDNSHSGTSPEARLARLGYPTFMALINDMLDLEDKNAWFEGMLNANCHLVLTMDKVGDCVDSDGTSLALNQNETLNRFECPTWKQYGVCASGPSGRGIQGMLMYTGTMSGDVPSHLLPSQMVELERSLTVQFGVTGARAAYILDQTAMWPSKASYPGIGTSKVEPLIMSTLDDSATGFGWTQQMKLAFPSAHLMTFQGYFHGFPSVFAKQTREGDLKGLYDCWEEMQNYVRTGELPRNGFVCHVNRYGVDSPPTVMGMQEWDFLQDSSQLSIEL